MSAWRIDHRQSPLTWQQMLTVNPDEDRGRVRALAAQVWAAGELESLIASLADGRVRPWVRPLPPAPDSLFPPKGRGLLSVPEQTGRLPPRLGASRTTVSETS